MHNDDYPPDTEFNKLFPLSVEKVQKILLEDTEDAEEMRKQLCQLYEQVLAAVKARGLYQSGEEVGILGLAS